MPDDGLLLDTPRATPDLIIKTPLTKKQKALRAKNKVAKQSRKKNRA